MLRRSLSRPKESVNSESELVHSRGWKLHSSRPDNGARVRFPSCNSCTSICKILKENAGHFPDRCHSSLLTGHEARGGPIECHRRSAKICAGSGTRYAWVGKRPPLEVHEQQRIQFLVRRDGAEAAYRWVERTLEQYRSAIDTPASHASKAEYRSRFEQAIGEFEQWLAEHPGGK